MPSKPKKTAQLIDGKKLADQILFDLHQRVARLPRHPGLAAILVGDDPASQLYVNNKKKACLKVGIEFHEYVAGGQQFFPQAKQADILAMVDWLNHDATIDGIIVQLPLPKQFDAQAILNHIDPHKDVDGLHQKNRGKFVSDSHYLTPPLIESIRLALLATGENLQNKTALIVAKNPIFTESLAAMLSQDGLKPRLVTAADTFLRPAMQKADIIISVVGRRHYIKKNMVKPGAIVVDAGITLVGKNKFVGDIDPKVAEVAGWLTPVPGGIGPLTVALLLKNLYQLAKQNQ